MKLSNGIWKALPTQRASHYAQFVEDYETIRSAEGRGSRDGDYYCKLPYAAASDPNAAQWKIRARTYEFLKDQILPALINNGARTVLDIGAGNAWLSYRLTQMGLRPVAIDLLINEMDGLGAACHYDANLREPFARMQADCNALPFQDAQFDIAIFNASFHYAEDYASVLGEALRCLKPGGTLLIADSPWYSREESGEQMLAERRSYFSQRFGRTSTALRSQEFLTDERLTELAQSFGIRWEQHVPSYGMRWRLRPLLAALKGRRKPSTFRIYQARKAA